MLNAISTAGPALLMVAVIAANWTAATNGAQPRLNSIDAKTGRSYLRLAEAGEPVLYEPSAENVRGIMPVAVPVQAGKSDLAICAAGLVLKIALAAADALRESTIFPSVVSIPFLGPVDRADFEPVWRKRNIITIEEHARAGGMGSLLREHAPDGVRFRSLCVDASRPHLVGSQQCFGRSTG